MCLYMYLLIICQHPKAPKIKRELRITKSTQKHKFENEFVPTCFFFVCGAN